LDRAEFDRYGDWLARRWSVTIDASAALEHEPYDPGRPLGDVAARLGIVEERDPVRGLTSDQATLFMGNALRQEGERFRGRSVWEVGCGTGVLSALAGRLGARRVFATDVDPAAVALARRTAERNDVALETAVASLFDDTPWGEPVDVLIADLPQKPVNGAPLPLGQDGGPEGSRWLLPFLAGARERLAPGGRLYFFVHSLTHPQSLVRLHELYRPRLLSTMWRIFENRSLSPILPYLAERRERGLCRYWDLPAGRGAFLCMAFSATRNLPGRLVSRRRKF